MPFALLPFMLLIVPVVEIGAFIAIGGQIGIGKTLLMILVTAVIGTFLLRTQGLSALNKVQTEINAGRVPGRALGDGAMILVAGIFLLTPGFVTDSIGFLLFVPFVRSFIWKFVSSRITIAVPGVGAGNGGFGDTPFGTPPHSMNEEMGDGNGPIIDLDEDDYQTGTTGSNSPWHNEEKDT
ncbi:MAG: FxsA family protein [Rhizobiaceae bacterium]